MLRANVSTAASNWIRLVDEINVWQSQRNQRGPRINWKFTTDKASAKLARAYPDPSLKEL